MGLRQPLTITQDAPKRAAKAKSKTVVIGTVSLVLNPIVWIALRTAQKCGHTLAVSFDGYRLTLTTQAAS